MELREVNEMLGTAITECELLAKELERSHDTADMDAVADRLRLNRERISFLKQEITRLEHERGLR